MTTLDQEKQLARPRRKKASIRMPAGYDRWIHFSMLWLLGFGLIMIASASMGLAVGNSGYLLRTVLKQLVFSIFGYVMMLMLARFFTLNFLRSGWFLNMEFLMIFLLFLTVAFPAVNGAKAWIRLTIPGVDMSVQPSEFAKVMIILITAAYCGDISRTFPNDREMLKLPLGFIVSYILIVLIVQSDLGSAVVMALIGFACLMIPSHPQMRKFQRVFSVLFWLALIGAIFLLSPWGEGIIRLLPLKEYQINRILSAINPFTDQYNTGYQLINGLVSFATGGWFGLGFGNSVRKYTSFPAANTDFILAIIVEELGIVGFAAVFIPYCIIVFRLLRYALKIRSEKARIILVGTAVYFVVHIILNVGGVTGLIPLTGVPLLMISAGGSSTFTIMSAVGLAQAVISQYHQGIIE